MSICGFWWDFQILTRALENVSDKCFKNASSSGGKTGGKNVLGTAHVLIYKFLAPSRYDFLHLPLSIEQQNWVRLANKGSLLLLPRSSWTVYMSSTHLPKVEGFTWLTAFFIKNAPAMQENWTRSLGCEDSPGEGNGNPLQYSCLENSTDRGAILLYLIKWAGSPGALSSASVSCEPTEVR